MRPGTYCRYETLTDSASTSPPTRRTKIRAFIALVIVLLFNSTPFSASGHPSSGIVVDSQGNVFVSDLSRGLLKVDPQGQVTTVSTEGGHWLALDANGSFSEVEFEKSSHWPRWFKRRTPAGERPALITDGGSPLIVTPDGNLFYVCNDERMIPGGLQLARLTRDGEETLVNPDLQRVAEEMGGIKGLAVGPEGSFFVSYPKAVLRVAQDGTFTTLLNPVVVPDCDRHPSSIQDAPGLRGLAVDARGVVYVAATGCRCVIKITPDAKVTTVLKAESPWAPCGVAVLGENVYVLEHINPNSEVHEDWPPRVRQVGRDGKITTLVTFAPPSSTPQNLVLQTPPPTAVNSVAVSPDGSLVAAAAGEGGVRLHDAKTGTLLRTIGGAGDRSVAFSPDGRSLAAGGFHMDKLIGVYDVRTGQRLQTLAGHTEWEVDACAISPDGKLLASTGVDKQLLVWDLATGALRHRLADQPLRNPALAFSPDGATLASASQKTVRLWDMTTGQLRQTLAGHRDWVCTVSFSPDGTTIASGSCDWGFHRGHDWSRSDENVPEQCEWRLWNVASGDLKRSVTESGRLLSLAFAPDGKSLACGLGTDVRLYDLSAEAPARIVTNHHFSVTSVAFAPDGTAVISGSHDHTVKRTNLSTGKVEWHAPGYFEQVNSVALSDDGSLLATGSSDGRFALGVRKASAQGIGPGAVRLWDARSGRLLRRLGDSADQIMAVTLSSNGQQVAAGGGSPAGSGVVHVWNVASGTLVWSAKDHEAEVLAVAFAPDGSSLASAGADGLVKLHDTQAGSVVRTLPDHVRGATSLAFSADGATLACGGGDGNTSLWEIHTGRRLRDFRPPRSQAATVQGDRPITSIALSRRGTTLATCTAGVNQTFAEPVRIWDVQTGELQHEFREISGRPMAVSPDGAVLATGGKWVQLWDARTGKPLRELFGHLKRTQSITFSSDGRLLFSGGSYGTTNVWEVASGKHLVTLFAFPEWRDGTVEDSWLAYHPDGYYNGSIDVDRFLAWRVGDELLTPASLGSRLHRPERIESVLKRQPNSRRIKNGRTSLLSDPFGR